MRRSTLEAKRSVRSPGLFCRYTQIRKICLFDKLLNEATGVSRVIHADGIRETY